MGRYNKFKKDLVFGKDLSDNKSKPYDQLGFDMVYDEHTLNIFSDASGFDHRKASYGIIAVCRDTIVHIATYVLEDATAQRAEALGLRLALLFAAANIHNYSRINIFSDSMNCIRCVKNYPDHEARPIKDEKGNIISYGLWSTSSNDFFKNGDVLSECIMIYRDLALVVDYSLVMLFHMNSHVITEKQSFDTNELDKARERFADINNTYGAPTREYFMYIAKYNNIIDYTVKMSLKEMIHRETKAHKLYTYCPIHFLPPKTPEEFFRKELPDL